MISPPVPARFAAATLPGPDKASYSQETQWLDLCRRHAVRQGPFWNSTCLAFDCEAMCLEPESNTVLTSDIPCMAIQGLAHCWSEELLDLRHDGVPDAHGVGGAAIMMRFINV